MFTQAYLHTAATLLGTYKGDEPFHLLLKTYFGANKKFGSRDRKLIAQLCYCWFRASRALQHLPQKDQFSVALFLTGGPSKLLESLAPHLNARAGESLVEKLAYVEAEVGFKPADIFPWKEDLSSAIDLAFFQQSFLIQPDLFLRLRPGKEAAVQAALANTAIPFQTVSEQCLRISNSAKVDAVIQLDRDAVVQDLNSQKLLQLFWEKAHGVLKKFTAWDCCAASGGKSILLADLFKEVQLTVSDIRPSILHNLQKRFQQARIHSYQKFVANAATDAPPRGQMFDLVLCDVPCTGSGTWSRTPEQLHYFDPEKIKTYAQLQKQIVANASRCVKRGGFLLYSTCSVFKAENEEVVAFLAAQNGMTFLKSSYYKGYQQKADTLFAALFQAL